MVLVTLLSVFGDEEKVNSQVDCKPDQVSFDLTSLVVGEVVMVGFL